MAEIRDNGLATLENMGSQMELEDTVFGIESDDADDMTDDDSDDNDDDSEALDEAMVDLDLEGAIGTSLENTTPPPTPSSSSSDMQKQRQEQMHMQQQAHNKPDTDSATESDINKIPEETEENAGHVFASMSRGNIDADLTTESCINEYDVLF